MRAIIKSKKHFVVFDLETDMIPRHVNRKNTPTNVKLKAIKELKVKCACAYSSKHKKYYFYQENNIQKLITLLNNSFAIAGYNILGFDLPVLEKYGAKLLLRKKSIDLCKEIANVLPGKQRVKLITAGKNLLSMDHSYKKKLFEKRKVNSRYETSAKELLAICKRDVQLTKKLLLFWAGKNEKQFKEDTRLALGAIMTMRQMDKIPTYADWKSYAKWKYKHWQGNYDRYRSWEMKRSWEENNCQSHSIQTEHCIYCKKGTLSAIALTNISPEKIKYISKDVWGIILKSRLLRMSYNEFASYKNGVWRPMHCNDCNTITLSDTKRKRSFSLS